MSVKVGFAIMAIFASTVGADGIPSAPTTPPAALDAATRSRVIQGIIRHLNDGYVFPETAKKMEGDLKEREARHEYDALVDGGAFATKLTTDLQAVCHDKHLRVRCSPTPLPERAAADAGPTTEEQERFRRGMRRWNYGLVRTEVLPGNVGLVQLNGFIGTDEAGERFATAMRFVADTDALILDLRHNGGGDPAQVQFVCSFFFPDAKTHLNDIYWRPTDETRQYWTLSHVPGPRYLDKPVYVLTSGGTFSGGEECCYNLKNLKRATLIGETTGGGANPGDSERLDGHFEMFVPKGRAISPITKTNWEGTGVAPDISVPAREALDRAQREALSALIAKTNDPELRREWEEARAKVGEPPAKEISHP